MTSQPKAIERPSPLEGRCHFFVERKRRYCRFHPAKTSNYCAEHILLYEPDNGKKRVICPYNPKHTCYENKLKHHMKKCPSRPMEMPPFYSKGINSGDNDGETVPDPKVTVVTLQLEVIESIIEKVERLHQEHVGNVEEDILSHPCLQEELEKKGYGNSALRQRKQQASLIGQMEKMGMLKDGTCFLEMGAGKGQMSHWLHAAVEDKKDIGFGLIERSHVRNKMDNLHKEEEAGHVMERVRIDIEDLKLDKVPTIEKHDRRVVAFGKHLCGGATDLALRCVAETLPNSAAVSTEEADESRRKRLKSDIKSLSGVSIAMCCHHRCTWTTYVGKAFFKSCGFTAKDFQIISSMSSWATCAWKGWSYQKKCEKEKSQEDEDNPVDTSNKLNTTVERKDQMVGEIDNSVPDKDDINLKTDEIGYDSESSHDKGLENTNKTGNSLIGSEGVAMITADKGNDVKKSNPNEGLDDVRAADTDQVTDGDDHTPVEDFTNTKIQCKLTEAEREKIGRKCKQLIDFGRVQYLRDHDMTSCIKIYIDEFYTPENVVLLATS